MASSLEPELVAIVASSLEPELAAIAASPVEAEVLLSSMLDEAVELLVAAPSPMLIVPILLARSVSSKQSGLAKLIPVLDTSPVSLAFLILM